MRSDSEPYPRRGQRTENGRHPLKARKCRNVRCTQHLSVAVGESSVWPTATGHYGSCVASRARAVPNLLILKDTISASLRQQTSQRVCRHRRLEVVGETHRTSSCLGSPLFLGKRSSSRQPLVPIQPSLTPPPSSSILVHASGDVAICMHSTSWKSGRGMLRRTSSGSCTHCRDWISPEVTWVVGLPLRHPSFDRDSGSPESSNGKCLVQYVWFRA